MKGAEYLIDKEFDAALAGENNVSYLLNPNGYESFWMERLIWNFHLMEENWVATFSY